MVTYRLKRETVDNLTGAILHFGSKSYSRVEQAVVYSTSTTGLSTFTFRGGVVVGGGGVEERNEVMYCIEGDMYIYYK